MSRKLLFLLGFAVASRAWGSPAYDIQPFFFPQLDRPASISYPNAQGQSIGCVFDYQENVLVTVPVLFQNGSFQILPLPPLYSAYPTVISDNGYIIGNAWNSTPPFAQIPQVPLLWSNGIVTQLPIANCFRGSALSVNNSGQVAGCLLHTVLEDPYTLPEEPLVVSAAWWDATGTLHDLGTFGGYETVARFINNAGQLLISVRNSDAPDQLLLWDNGITQPIPGATGGAVGFNNLGHVLYRTDVDICEEGLTDFALWDGTKSTPLPTLPNYLTMYDAFNDQDQIVGCAINFDISDDRAILWDNGILYDLNDLIPADSGWELQYAGGIASDGQIVGNGYFNGIPHAFLLTPIPSVPEPATLPILALATFALARRRA